MIQLKCFSGISCHVGVSFIPLLLPSDTVMKYTVSADVVINIDYEHVNLLSKKCIV